MVSLKCGHLFGAGCIKRWLKTQRVADRSCPTCKTKANMKDLRCIFAPRVVKADNSQVTSLRQQIERLKADKTRLALELQKSKRAYRQILMQLSRLQTRVWRLHGDDIPTTL